MSELTSVVSFEPTRQAALDHLSRALDQIASYRLSSLDLGPEDRSNVTTLGVYLSSGLLRPEEVVHQAFQRYKPAELLRFLESLSHHTYSRAWLETRPQLWANWRRTVADELRTSADNPVYRAATAGKTEVPAFNQWVQELVQTGYLHHQARRAFASIWLFTLKLPWSLGADLFARHLLDGCHASNLFQWRTVAGLQGGKPYLVSGKAIAKQSQGRICADQPLAGEGRPVRGLNPPAGLLAPYPQRPSDKLGDRYALLLSGEDLTPEVGVLSELSPNCVLTLKMDSAELGYESPVAEFRGRALAAAGQRVAEFYRSPQRVLSWDEDAPAALEQLAQELDFQNVIYYEPYVGPWKDRLTALTGRDVGVRFFPLRRRWDAKLFGLASRGFVQFWKQTRPKLHSLTGQ